MSTPNENEFGSQDQNVENALNEMVSNDSETKPSEKDSFVSEQVKMSISPLTPYEGDEAPIFPAHLFRQTDSEISETVTGYKNTDPSIGEEGQRWVRSIRGAQKMRVAKKLHEKNLEQGDWNQFVETGSSRAYSREVRGTVVDRQISGARAINHLRYVMHMGQEREVPLFASGVYITLRSIPDTELSNLETLVLSEKEAIGRATGGAALSATSVYLVDHVCTMITNNMLKTNVEINTPDELLDLILVTDVQNLAANQAHTIFPKGYPIEIPCTRDYEKCQHVETFNLVLSYMVEHDQSKLTEYQRVFMSNPDRKITVKDVKKYQEEGPVKISKVVEVQSGAIRVDFRTPTLREYIIDGRAWIDGIAEIVDNVVNDNINERQRDIMVEDQARLTTLRQYGHFIKSITIVNDGIESTITDRETLLSALKDLSGNDEAINAIVAGVREHIEAATVSVVGVPKTPCPKCQADVTLTEEEKKRPKLVPVDALNLFFTLLSLKLAKRQQTKLQDI